MIVRIRNDPRRHRGPADDVARVTGSGSPADSGTLPLGDEPVGVGCRSLYGTNGPAPYGALRKRSTTAQHIGDGLFGRADSELCHGRPSRDRSVVPIATGVVTLHRYRDRLEDLGRVLLNMTSCRK